jgi:release factor glutamine methyltransferase
MNSPTTSVSLNPPRYGAIGALLGRVMFWCRRLVGGERYDRLAIEWIQGLPFVVIPSVFNPRALRTGEFFASTIDADVVRADADVLDMGTGSGVCAVFAAKRARRVVAIDINSAAVRCARINALMNHVEHKVEVRYGDLFAPVRDERFDLILFNPPFIRGIPKDERDCAWRSPDAAQRFAAGLAEHLKPDGCALVLLSTFGDAPSFVKDFHEQSLAVSIYAEREFVNERVTILKIAPVSGAA